MKVIKITSLGYAILGLVHHQPQSGYAIRKQFETTALGNYSSSPGAIYPALQRLQKLGLVIKQLATDDNKNKFSCTKAGENVLKEWFLSSISTEDIAKRNEELLLRFAFMDKLVSKDQALEFLKSYHTTLKTYIAGLSDFYHKENGNLPLHGRLAFEHGLASNKATLKWCKMAMDTLNHKN